MAEGNGDLAQLESRVEAIWEKLTRLPVERLIGLPDRITRLEVDVAHLATVQNDWPERMRAIEDFVLIAKRDYKDAKERKERRDKWLLGIAASLAVSFILMAVSAFGQLLVLLKTSGAPVSP